MRQRVVTGRLRGDLFDRSRPVPSLRSARPTGLPAGLLAALLVALSLLAFAPHPGAVADEPSALVRITVTSFSPSVVKPGDTVRISGTVTNVSDESLGQLSAYFWRSTFPLTSSEQLTAARQSDSNDPIGARRFGFGEYDPLFSTAHPSLAPKASVAFSLSATTTELIGANPTNGVYLMGVQVLQPGSNAIGRARIFVPVVNPQLSSAASNSVQLSSLVMLTSSPSQLRTGVLADDHLANEVAEGGRLDGLLNAAGQPGTSYAVDPDLIVELRTMSAGYQVVGSDGELVAGTGRAAAQAWLRRFAALQTGHDGYRLPYAQYDLAALVHDDRLGVAQAAEAAAKQVDDVGALPLLVVPPEGAADQATVEAATRLGARAVVLDDATIDGLGPVVKQKSGPTILGYDTSASVGGPGPAPDDTPVHLRQSGLATTYIEALTSQTDTTVGRLRLVTQPDQAGVDLDSSTAPWLKFSDVGQLLAGTPVSWSGRPSYSDANRKHELSSRQLAATAMLAGDFTAYRELLATPDALSTQQDQSLARVVSTAWRGRNSAQRQFVHQQVGVFDQVLRGSTIHLEAKDLVLTGAAGNVPITVVNGFSEPIRVQIAFSSPNRQRLSVQDVPASTIGVIEAGSRAPVTAEVQARANGQLPITAQLMTTSGMAIGAPLTIQINPTQAGRIGWLISLGALIVLIGATAFRIRQVRRERGSEPAG